MSESVPKPLIDRTITLGAMLQVAVLLVGFIGYQFSNSGRVENTAEQVKRLEAQVAAQATQTREIIRESVSRVELVVAGLQTQVSGLPTMTERLRQFEDQIKRLEDRDGQTAKYLDDRRAAGDQRFMSLEQRAIESISAIRELRAAIDSIHAGSRVNLPGQPGLRR